MAGSLYVRDTVRQWRPLVYHRGAGVQRCAQAGTVAASLASPLLGKLAASGCQFNRNGSWHSAVEAKSHLLNKLGYLERKDLVQTAEQFIERGAAGSSVSGKPYLVKCGNAEAAPSQRWLTAELKALRGTARSPAATKH